LRDAIYASKENPATLKLLLDNGDAFSEAAMEVAGASAIRSSIARSRLKTCPR